jgi:hypothetical protein
MGSFTYILLTIDHIVQKRPFDGRRLKDTWFLAVKDGLRLIVLPLHDVV